MKRSIADVYACRKDFYDANKELVEEVCGRLLKGCEELTSMKTKANPKTRMPQPATRPF